MSNVYYYAIRDVSDDESASVENALNVPVSYITHCTHLFSSRWVHRRLERLAKHITRIEKWEYDMLDAFDVPKVGMHEVLEWESTT